MRFDPTKVARTTVKGREVVDAEDYDKLLAIQVEQRVMIRALRKDLDVISTDISRLSSALDYEELTLEERQDMVADNQEWDRFNAVMKQILSVSHEEIQRRMAATKKATQAKRAAKKSSMEK